MGVRNRNPLATSAVVAVNPPRDVSLFSMVVTPVKRAVALFSEVGRACCADPWRLSKFFCVRAKFACLRAASAAGVAAFIADFRSSKSSVIACPPVCGGL